MSLNFSTHQIRNNLFYSVGAQALSLTASIVLGLVVPKAIPQLQYAYWQTYLLYASYVGILHFGLLDGIVLRYSQYDYEELELPRVKSQFQFLLLINSLCAFLLLILANHLWHGVDQTIAILVAFSIIVKNVHTYTSFIFQITNRIKYYASLTILHRGIYLAIILGLLFCKSTYFVGFCLADIGADILGVLLMMRYNKGLYIGKAIPFLDTLSEAWVNTSSGILLMAANWSAMLLVGSAKMVVQWHWDAITFGKISFGFSLSGLFLTFVGAISVVLFPTLKRLNTEALPNLYVKIRQSVSIMLFVLMLGYFPGGYILQWWLPKYADSIVYLGILLPLVIFSSKVSLLTNNYLKAYREEKKMFAINFFSIVVAFLAYLACAYVWHSLTALLVVIVLMIMMRSVLSEVIVGKLIKRKFTGEFIQEFVMSVLFIICARYFSLWVGFGIYAMLVTIYLFWHRNDLKLFKNTLFKFVPVRFHN